MRFCSSLRAFTLFVSLFLSYSDFISKSDFSSFRGDSILFAGVFPVKDRGTGLLKSGACTRKAPYQKQHPVSMIEVNNILNGLTMQSFFGIQKNQKNTVQPNNQESESSFSEECILIVLTTFRLPFETCFVTVGLNRI